MKHSRLIRLAATVCILALLAGMTVLPVQTACAGSNEVIVATDGDGAPVYTSSSGSKKAGIL